MITINDNIYRAIASRLMDAVGVENYFNGSVSCDAEEFCATLVATLIIYRNPEKITDVVPVWWEFRLAGIDGQAQNDFAWSELKEFLTEYF